MQRTLLVLLATVLAAGAVQAQDKFARKSGLWEVTRTSTLAAEGQKRVLQLCVDQASDDALQQISGGGANERCKMDSVRREGDKLLVDAVCTIGQTTKSKTQAVLTGSSDSAYKVESKSTYVPPLKGKSEGSTVLEGKWMGACKANQKPGDMILPTGVKVNAADEEKAASEKVRKKGKGGYIGVPVPTKPVPTK